MLESSVTQTNSTSESDKVKLQNTMNQLKLANVDIEYKQNEIKKMKTDQEKTIQTNALKFEEMENKLNAIVEEKNNEINSLKSLQNEENVNMKTQYGTIVSNLKKSNETLKASFEKLTSEKKEVDSIVQKCEETNATLKKRIEDVETLKSTQEKELNSLKKVLEQKISATNDDAANLNMKIQMIKL